jgi:SAM-dependent methyltransferase/DNA-binding transcriptional MerR regulator
VNALSDALISRGLRINSLAAFSGRSCHIDRRHIVQAYDQLVPAELTIEQLAAESGMSVRNIRAHQARGLLAPPEVRLRVGYYGPEHVARLRLIRDLQDDGFNLAGIKRLLNDSGTAERLERFRQALTSPSNAERPQTLTVAELGRRFRVSAEDAPQVLARAQRLGVLVAAGEDRFEVPSPALLDVAERVVERGISLDGALAVFEEIEQHCDAVSGSFVRLFLEEVWQPFLAAGVPVERWAEIEESIDRLRPLATEALLAIFGQRMSAQIESAFGQAGHRFPASPRGVRGAGHLGYPGPVSATGPDEQRAASREMWERAASGWGKRADRIRDWGMPVAAAMLDALALQPGQRVLELAAGPGDTGFMAAELIAPGGELVTSDGAEAMLAVARERAAQAGLRQVEFLQLELEWIDLPTASVDAVLCRWGIMLIVDPAAAAQEIRRVLRSGGRAALAVWDVSARNPWATIPNAAMVSLGHAEPPPPGPPGMFALGGDGQLQALLESAGFVEVRVEPVALERHFADLDSFIAETVELSPMFRGTFNELSESDQREIVNQIADGAREFTAADGSVTFPGSSLVAVAFA